MNRWYNNWIDDNKIDDDSERKTTQLINKMIKKYLLLI